MWAGRQLSETTAPSPGNLRKTALVGITHCGSGDWGEGYHESNIDINKPLQRVYTEEGAKPKYRECMWS